MGRRSGTQSASEDKYRDGRNFESTSHQIRAWLDDDINARGYAGMTDAEVEADMLVDLVDTQREAVTGLELFEQTDKTELGLLRAGTLATGDADPARQYDDYRMWVADVADDQKTYRKSGPITDVLKDIWGNTSQSWQNFVDYFNSAYQVDRGTWLIGRVITQTDIATARAL